MKINENEMEEVLNHLIKTIKKSRTKTHPTLNNYVFITNYDDNSRIISQLKAIENTKLREIIDITDAYRGDNGELIPDSKGLWCLDLVASIVWNYFVFNKDLKESIIEHALNYDIPVDDLLLLIKPLR